MTLSLFGGHPTGPRSPRHGGLARRGRSFAPRIPPEPSQSRPSKILAGRRGSTPEIIHRRTTHSPKAPSKELDLMFRVTRRRLAAISLLLAGSLIYSPSAGEVGRACVGHGTPLAVKT